MLERLSIEQWLEWEEYAAIEGFGGLAEDMRFEAFRRRLVAAFGGGEMPSAAFPYFRDPIDPAKLAAEMERLDAELVPNGRGGYDWRNKCPQPSPS